MKYIIVLILLFGLHEYQAQISYTFLKALPPDAEVTVAVNPSHFGSYKSPETGTIFEFTDHGIEMVLLINSFISKEQVRESSRFQCRNGYLFGVVEGDSVPCIFEEDKYYFAIRQKTLLNGMSYGAVLKQLDRNSYILNFKESSGFSPSLLKFKGKDLYLSHFDYDSGTTIFDEVVLKDIEKEKDFDTFILNPQPEEFAKLLKKEMFDTPRKFNKQ